MPMPANRRRDDWSRAPGSRPARQSGRHDIVELLAGDKMTAAGVEAFALSDIAKAHARAEGGRNLEKVVVNPFRRSTFGSARPDAAIPEMIDVDCRTD